MRRVAEPQPGIGLRIRDKEEEGSHRGVVVELQETQEAVTTRSLEHRPGRTYVEPSIAREVALERYFSRSGLEVWLCSEAGATAGNRLQQAVARVVALFLLFRRHAPSTRREPRYTRK